MKRKSLRFFLLVFVALTLMSFGYWYVQKSTEFRQIAGVRYYNSKDVSNLALLCKVWGYLKYYHPSVVEGKYDWDEELIKMLPKVLKSGSKVDRNKLLSEWITSLGEFKQETLPEINPDSVKMYPDLDWIKDRTELGTLSTQLERIKTAKRSQTKSHFVELIMGIGNPVFLNEKTYPEMSYPNASYRLLTLSRYWNIIQYYFPYKYLIGENWQKVLVKFIPQFINAKNELEYKLIICKLVACIHDSHAFLSDNTLEKYKGDYIVPLCVSFIEGKPVITDTIIDISKIRYPAKIVVSFVKGKPVMKDTLINSSKKNYPLKIGDIILKVNGESVDKIISKRLPYTNGSNLSAQMRDLSFDLLRSNQNCIEITFLRNSKIHRNKINCYSIASAIAANNYRNIFQKNKPVYKILSRDKDIGYLYLGSSIGGTIPDFSDTKGLIIDLRCYPNQEVKGYLNLQELFKRPVRFVRFTSSDFKRPGLFKSLLEHQTDLYRMFPSEHFSKTSFYKGKVIILVNEVTQSHAEFMAMLYRCSPTATVIGSTTSGADGDVSWIPLPGNIQTRMSGIGVYYPDGRETQRVGIVPDIEVKPTIKGISEGRDEVLEKAIELIAKYK